MKTEHLTKYVSSYGLKNLFLNPITSNYQVFYISVYEISHFIHTKLPHINSKFVLVTNDGDYRFDESFIEKYNINKILENTFFEKWFIQNLYTNHFKLNHLPIGNDYHTMYLHRDAWGEGISSPFKQENFLENILIFSPQLKNRKNIAYCNWHFHLERGDRTHCYNSIDHNSCFFEPKKVDRFTTWKNQSKCTFVISPEGGGPDCHRTWEALMLGCIPILKKSPLSSLFKDLPCVFVNDWNEINQNFLDSALEQILNSNFNFSKLFIEYWKNLIFQNTFFDISIMQVNSLKDLYI